MSGEIEGIKVKEVYNSDGTTHNSWVIKCPGCGDYHLIDNRWEFNGDIKHPTFRPSLMCSWKYTDERDERTCHSFITNGYIAFQNDCTHSHKNENLELPDFPMDWNKGKDRY